MTRPDIESIETRVNAATPGPWFTDEGTVIVGPLVHGIGREIGDFLYDVNGERLEYGYRSESIRDSRFAAEARTDVPALILWIRHLELRLKQAELDGAIRVAGEKLAK